MQAVEKIAMVKVRVKSAPAPAKGRRDDRFLVTFVAISIAFAAVFSVQVAQKVLIAQQSFVIEDLNKKIEAQKLTQEKLRIKISSLRSPERIEDIAKNQLKMVLPAEVNYIKHEEPVKTSVKPKKTVTGKIEKKTPGVIEKLAGKLAGIKLPEIPSSFTSSL